ncbi:MAG: hypothetical protein Q9169_006201 [Polycauliona sp. 2 TL-2023]
MSGNYRLQYGNIAPTKQRYQEHKDAYRRQRNSFRSDPRALPELEAWRKGDDSFDYQLLNQSGKAFIPPGLIGKGLDGLKPWAKSDTFFSEYALHNPSALILSETDHSYIIGNNASHDGRQYPLAVTEKRPEGQGYCHTLVIPKPRVYNAVDPLATEGNCFILRELREHFLAYWSNQTNRQAMLDRARKALEDRDAILINGKATRPPEYTNAVRTAVFSDFGNMEAEFKRLSSSSDFLFGFHVFPENSIGHLHMHVFPFHDSYRQFSTRDYDYKTVPLQAILDVEQEDMGPSPQQSSAKGFVPVNS